MTSPLIAEVLAAAGLSSLGVALAVVVGQAIVVTNLCASSPPPMPQLDPTLSNNSVGVLLQAFSAAAWPFYCQCVPGTPAPINFPPPTFTPPAGWPSSPVFACDPANLCATLSAIETLLNTVNATTTNTYATATLLQRYGLPFAAIPGAFHNTLSSFGSFPIPRLVGIQYQVDQLPPNVVVRPGVNQYIRDLGWIGFTLPGGQVAEHRVTRQQEFWFPPLAQAATSFGWDLTPGTIISVREMYAEP